MATANKILGQSKPGAGVSTVLYTVPGGKEANVNIFAANEGVNDTIRISLAQAGAVLDPKQYIAYDMNINANGTLNFTGISLAATDVIRVLSTNGTTAFIATGIEIS